MWLTTCAQDFEKNGWSAIVPELPNPAEPDVDEWVAAIEKALEGNFQDVLFVGHSLGGLAVLHALQHHEVDEIAALSVLVATPFDSVDRPAIENFLPPLDWNAITRHCAKFACVYAKDDLIVPPAHGKKFQRKLQAEMMEFQGKGHFDQDTFPELEKIILDLL